MIIIIINKCSSRTHCSVHSVQMLVVIVGKYVVASHIHIRIYAHAANGHQKKFNKHVPNTISDYFLRFARFKRSKHGIRTHTRHMHPSDAAPIVTTLQYGTFTAQRYYALTIASGLPVCALFYTVIVCYMTCMHCVFIYGERRAYLRRKHKHASKIFMYFYTLEEMNDDDDDDYSDNDNNKTNKKEKKGK